MPDSPREGSRKPATTGSWQQAFREAGPYLGLGMQLALTMAFFTVGGYFLDQWMETTPWLTIAGAVLGMVLVFVQLIRVSHGLSRKPKQTPESTGRE